jgi:hypothetical protein
MVSEDTPAGGMEPGAAENIATFHLRQQNSYITSIESHSSSFAKQIFRDRETDHPELFSDHESWINLTPCMSQLRDYFTHCSHNKTLKEHLDCVEKLLKEIPSGSNAGTVKPSYGMDTSLVYTFEKDRRQDILSACHSRTSGMNTTSLCLDNLPGTKDISKPYSLLSIVEQQIARSERLIDDHIHQGANIPAVEGLINTVDDGKSTKLMQDGLSALYAQELRHSILALERNMASLSLHQQATPHSINHHHCYVNLCGLRTQWKDLLGFIQGSLRTRQTTEHALADSLLSDAGLISRMPMIPLLAHLSSHHKLSTPSTRESSLLRLLAESFILFQHARRIWQAAHLGNSGELMVEYENWRTSFDHEDDATLLFQESEKQGSLLILLILFCRLIMIFEYGFLSSTLLGR